MVTGTTNMREMFGIATWLSTPTATTAAKAVNANAAR
jgi:hypothetical protein